MISSVFMLGCYDVDNEGRKYQTDCNTVTGIESQVVKGYI